MSQTAKVWEARAWQRGRRSAPRPFLIMKPSLIKAKDNYFPISFAPWPHHFCCQHFLLFVVSIVFVYRPTLSAPYGCRSNNVKHFALASFCNLQFPNVRPVESRSDNRHARPPGVFVPPYLRSINATAGVSCNNTCTSEMSTWARDGKGRQEGGTEAGGKRCMRGKQPPPLKKKHNPPKNN